MKIDCCVGDPPIPSLFDRARSNPALSRYLQLWEVGLETTHITCAGKFKLESIDWWAMMDMTKENKLVCAAPSTRGEMRFCFKSLLSNFRHRLLGMWMTWSSLSLLGEEFARRCHALELGYRRTRCTFFLFGNQISFDIPARLIPQHLSLPSKFLYGVSMRGTFFFFLFFLTSSLHTRQISYIYIYI